MALKEELMQIENNKKELNNDLKKSMIASQENFR